MIARKDAIEKIIKSLSLFVQEVKSYVAINKYDISIYGENVLIPILNAVYELNLINANSERKNFPAVDLIDRINRISFQVSVTPSQEKVTETLIKFLDHKLNLDFDTLFIYVLTEKAGKYNKFKLREIAKDSFDVDNNLQVIDYSDILKKVNEVIKLDRLNAISRIFEQEFSDVQIQGRSKKFKDGYLTSSSEEIFPNLAKIKFSENIYIADPILDFSVDLRYVNNERRNEYLPRLKYLSDQVAFAHTLQKNNFFHVDWVLYENKLISFRNLNDQNEPLSQFADKGTIETIKPSEFYNTSENHLNVFKNLLRNCLRHLAFTKNMEWVGDRRIIRFRNDENVPREKKTNWRGKKDSTKTVIFEVMTKKKENEESHIVCFRSMAFKPSFYFIADVWYLCINPTWSFTNPGGHKQSRFEADYMSGLKRLESNNTVYYQFRFFVYFLSNTPPLFVEQYPHLKVLPLEALDFNPGILDEKWLPMKIYTARNERESELFEDKELNSNLI